MAKRKPTKEEAKRRIDELPIIPKLGLPLGGPTIGELAKAFVDEDPLGRTAPRPDTSNAESRLMMAMVNDPQFKLTQDVVDLINDDDRILLSDGVNMIESNRFSPSIRGQFDRASLVSRISSAPGRKKRPRKATKTDKMMSKALEQANKELRKQNGKLRKGVTQADVMTRAHRIRRKLESQ